MDYNKLLSYCIRSHAFVVVLLINMRNCETKLCVSKRPYCFSFKAQSNLCTRKQGRKNLSQRTRFHSFQEINLSYEAFFGLVHANTSRPKFWAKQFIHKEKALLFYRSLTATVKQSPLSAQHLFIVSIHLLPDAPQAFDPQQQTAKPAISNSKRLPFAKGNGKYTP